MTKKRFVLVLMLAVSICTAIVFRKDITDAALSFYFSQRTRYAAKYNEREFRKIVAGDSQQAVRRRLGEPLAVRVFPDGEIVWYYTEQKTGTDNYFVRNVLFDRRGVVNRTYSEFYLD